MGSISVRAEGTEVLMIDNGSGKTGLRVHWSIAEMLAKALIAKAREAEEVEKADSVILDAAILFRSGAPFSLSRNPDIMHEAVKEAQHNTILRRHMQGIKSAEMFGAPRLIKHMPRSV